MVSGLYLGELTRLVLMDYINKGFLFDGELSDKELARISKKGSFQAPFMTKIAQDNSSQLKEIHAQLIEWGIESQYISLEDKRIIKDICKAVAMRAARITAAVVFAIVRHIDEQIRQRHVVAIDGSLFEKHYDFKQDMKEALKALSWEVFKEDRSGRISLELTTGGSGLGAALIAAMSTQERPA
jgi:hexokinase